MTSTATAPDTDTPTTDIPTHRERHRRGWHLPRLDAERAEGGALLALTLVVGAGAAAFAWSTVLDLAGKHGQRDLWRALIVAGCIETLAVIGGLDARRRHRKGQPLLPAVALMAVSAGVQLLVQLSEAPRDDRWAQFFAVVPAVTFLVLVKMVLGRSAAPGKALADALARADAAEQRAAAAEARADEATRRRRDDDRPAPRTARPATSSTPTMTDADRERITRLVLAGGTDPDTGTSFMPNPGAGRRTVAAAITALGHSPGANDRLTKLVEDVRATLPNHDAAATGTD